MHRLARLFCLALPLALVDAVDNRGPGYADLRLSGGLAGTKAGQVAFGVICGDLSEGYEGSWAGLVFGGRLYAASGWRLDPADGGEQTRANLAGGQAVAGLGLTLGKRDHVELLALYGGGVWGNHLRSKDSDLVGHFKQMGGELGYYHTFARGFQIGATVGYSVLDAELDTGIGSATYAGRGFDAVLVIGRRF